MPTTDPLDILLQHDRWATRLILQACEKLSPEQFSRKFDLGPGSLQATTAHIIAAMKTWTDTLAQRPLAPRVDQNVAGYTPAILLPMHEDSAAEFAAVAKQHPLNQIVKRTRDGKDFSFPRGVVITHVATHGMHHRAQCLNMLKQLGVSPLPPSSVTEWSRMADASP